MWTHNTHKKKWWIYNQLCISTFSQKKKLCISTCAAFDLVHGAKYLDQRLTDQECRPRNLFKINQLGQGIICATKKMKKQRGKCTHPIRKTILKIVFYQSLCFIKVIILWAHSMEQPVRYCLVALVVGGMDKPFKYWKKGK